MSIFDVPLGLEPVEPGRGHNPTLDRIEEIRQTHGLGCGLEEDSTIATIFHLESRIWKVEKPLFEQWLDLESDFIRHMTEEAGFRIAFDRKDLRAHYLIYKKV